MFFIVRVVQESYIYRWNCIKTGNLVCRHRRYDHIHIKALHQDKGSATVEDGIHDVTLSKHMIEGHKTEANILRDHFFVVTHILGAIQEVTVRKHSTFRYSGGTSCIEYSCHIIFFALYALTLGFLHLLFPNK